MNYSDFYDIYNQFQELQKQINELDEKINKNINFPVITFALCCITIVFCVVVFICFGIWFYKTAKEYSED